MHSVYRIAVSKNYCVPDISDFENTEVYISFSVYFPMAENERFHDLLMYKSNLILLCPFVS
jgi:hypothetical protein